MCASPLPERQYRFIGNLWQSAIIVAITGINGGHNVQTLLTPVSIGELIDKITILEIKEARIAAPEALANVRRELAALRAVVAASLPMTATLAGLRGALHAVNAELWDIEDAIREEERRQEFGAEFIRLARAVYRRNDERAALKRQVNEASGSALVEEKSYRDWRA